MSAANRSGLYYEKSGVYFSNLVVLNKLNSQSFKNSVSQLTGIYNAASSKAHS